MERCYTHRQHLDDSRSSKLFENLQCRWSLQRRPRDGPRPPARHKPRLHRPCSRRDNSNGISYTHNIGQTTSNLKIPPTQHRTNSVDYNILLSGRLILILGDNSETEVEAGNVVVQRGTMHAWRNPSETEWSRWVSVLIHAEAVEVGGKELEEVWDA